MDFFVEVASVEAFVEDFMEVTSVEASVEAFMEAFVEVASVEASVQAFMEALTSFHQKCRWCR